MAGNGHDGPRSHNKKPTWPKIVILPYREWQEVSSQCESQGGLREMTSPSGWRDIMIWQKLLFCSKPLMGVFYILQCLLPADFLLRCQSVIAG